MNRYTFHINLYDLAFLGTIFIGLTFAVLLLFTNSINRAAKKFLGLALMVMVLWMIRVLGIDIRLAAYYPHWTSVPLQFSLALGPLIYFYVLKLTRPERKLGWKDLLHFSAVLLQSGVNFLSVGSQLNPILQLLTFVSVITYLYLSHRLIESFYHHLKFNGGDRYRNELQWLRRLLTGFGMLWLLWIPYTAVNYFGYHNQLSPAAYYPLYLLLAITMIWIGAVAFLRPEVELPAELSPASKPSASTELKQKGAWLKKAMADKRLYQDPELSLSSLAEKLEIHTHELSRIINIALKKNFSDFINDFRVRDVVRKMQDPAYDRITLLGIAYESGFNSKSTFNRIFKQVTGKSPVEYKADLKKERPTYKLRRNAPNAPVVLHRATTSKWSHEKLNRNFMFRNYFKIAWRNLARQKLFSLINISGLAVGLAVCMLIMIYVAHEHSYDRFHKNADRIFKPSGQMKMNGNTFGIDQMSYVSGPIIKQSLAVVAGYMRTTHYVTSVVLVSNPSRPDQKFAENNLLFADAGFFNFFSFKLLSGRPAQVLSKPFSVVISQDMAKKYFGDENPVGKTLTIKTDSAYTYQVTGVAENCPSNSSIEYNFVASNSGFVTTKAAKDYLGDQKLGGGTFDVFLLLRHRSDTAALTKGLRSLNTDITPKAQIDFSLLPLAGLHLKTPDDTNIKCLTVFPLVALLILLLALVNYMSLSTARATLRAKEIGVRKISGASRKSVALQFYIESAVFATLSFLLGYLLCYFFKPVFFNVLQLKIDDSFLFSPLMLSLLCGLLLVTIVVSGSYPSLVLSAFKPVVTLKGKMGKQSGGVLIRKIFTTLQFSISVALIICGIVIDRQLYFFRHTDTGVDRDNVVMIPVGSNFKNYPAFNHDIRTLAGVSAVSTSRYGMFSYYDMIGIPGKTKDESVMLPSLDVDQDFFQLTELKWKYAPLPHDNLGVGNKIVLNELAVEKLHLPTNPLGSYIPGCKTIVAGVVKNFNFGSLEDPIQPLGLWVLTDTAKFWKTEGGCFLFARIKPRTNLPTLLGAMQMIYKKYDADTPFNYTFMDDAFNARYKAEDRLASIFSIFTVITIVLAGMGLFGLAAFTIEQRTKEIGIRKVLGASISSINGLLSKDFLKLVLLSILIASPIAWYAMHNWLQGFAYRISIQWWMFAGAGLLAVVVAVITISYHAIKAAVVNPVNSLRSE
ncbi:MAG TPA: ABC transporter permease [Mucilaginibacter sp.]|nr:ABC transporter permease [Mucilaginibacter sp.]